MKPWFSLRLPLRLAPMIVRLLLGQPEDLLDPRPQPGERRSAVLLKLLAGVGELLLDPVEPLLRLAQAALGVVHPLFGLGAHLVRLGHGGVESLDGLIDLPAVIAAEDDTELAFGACAVEERNRGLLLRHWHILADTRGCSARASSALFGRTSSPDSCVVHVVRTWSSDNGLMPTKSSAANTEREL